MESRIAIVAMNFGSPNTPFRPTSHAPTSIGIPSPRLPWSRLPIDLAQTSLAVFLHPAYRISSTTATQSCKIHVANSLDESLREPHRMTVRRARSRLISTGLSFSLSYPYVFPRHRTVAVSFRKAAMGSNVRPLKAEPVRARERRPRGG